MEYFLGSVTTLITIFVFKKFILNKEKISVPENKNIYSQSYMHKILLPFLPTNSQINRMTPKKTQARLFYNKLYIKILFLDNKAYWIKDNTFYSADVVDKQVIEETTKIVDIMSMDKVELDKMSFIVEKLTEGLNNDNRNSGI